MVSFEKSSLFLFLGSSLICLLVIEMGYRIFDPFPFYNSEEINNTDHGNLTEYDAILGWKGVPEGGAEFVTRNNKVWLAHNRGGFRDIEHNSSSEKKQAIVFLGDSFTWGFEVEFDEMFVNRLRDKLPNYTIINLSHRGYGTDQSLLTFQRWVYDGPILLVILMFCENDLEDNISRFRYHKPKPLYQFVEDRIMLTGIPVPRLDAWTVSNNTKTKKITCRKKVKRILLKSHFFHDVYFRYKLIRKRRQRDQTQQYIPENDGYLVTSRIIKELKNEVEKRGAKLVVSLIPSKREIEKLDHSDPYQIKIADLCQKLSISYIDLAPDFKATYRRTYYRQGVHWNSHGHKKAADALFDYLSGVTNHLSSIEMY